jgi:hypothetical protein
MNAQDRGAGGWLALTVRRLRKARHPKRPHPWGAGIFTRRATKLGTPYGGCGSASATAAWASLNIRIFQTSDCKTPNHFAPSWCASDAHTFESTDGWFAARAGARRIRQFTALLTRAG